MEQNDGDGGDKVKRKFESGFQRRAKKHKQDLAKAAADPRQRKLFAVFAADPGPTTESTNSSSVTASHDSHQPPSTSSSTSTSSVVLDVAAAVLDEAGPSGVVGVSS
jgi:heme-binding NEAT domain protein